MQPATAPDLTSRSKSGTPPCEFPAQQHGTSKQPHRERGSSPVSYGWPLKPFDQQHPVRGFFCDPRIGDQGDRSFHFGVDVAALDGTPVFAVEAGTVRLQGPQNVAALAAEGRSHGYWHIVPTVRHGQQMAKLALLGHIAAGWGHVHFAERRGGHYLNPLRAGGLTPFHDFGAPVIDRILAEAGGAPLNPRALTGVINLIAVAHDNPPISAPPPWRGLPVTPALVRWRLVRDAHEVIPWRVVANFRSRLLPKARFTAIYAAGTRQNHPTPPASTASGSPAAGTHTSSTTASTGSTSKQQTSAEMPRADNSANAHKRAALGHGRRSSLVVGPGVLLLRARRGVARGFARLRH
jgi:Peptidase family M23